MNETNEPRADDAPQGADERSTQTDTDLQAMQQERDHLEEQLRRALADAANMRRRAQKEAEDSRRRIVEGFTQELLPVLDNFQLALQSWDEQQDHQDPSALVQGVRMVQTLLMSALERHGLQPIAAEGQPFDPARHEAVAVEPRADVKANQVVRVLVPGYLLSDRVLRHAKVVVAGEAPGAGG
ncbi:MAG: nucleotide exchange factor GrpE [Planctomycetota bacterium]